MRAVFQEQPEVAPVYLGRRRHVMDEIFNDRNQPFGRSAKTVEIGPIDPVHFAPFLVERFDASGKAISSEAVAAVLDAPVVRSSFSRHSPVSQGVRSAPSTGGAEGWARRPTFSAP